MSLRGEEHTQVLIVQDNHSGSVWLTPTKDSKAETVTIIIIIGFSTFGIVQQ